MKNTFLVGVTVEYHQGLFKSCIDGSVHTEFGALGGSGCQSVFREKGGAVQSELFKPL